MDNTNSNKGAGTRQHPARKRGLGQKLLKLDFFA